MKALILSALLAVPCFAQGVTGSVTHAGTGAPVPGAVVTLHDSAGRRLGLASVADDGRYRLTAPAPGRYRVRAMRIGFRPGDSGLLDVAGEMRQADLTMSPLGQLLDTIRVLRTANCIRDGTSAFAVWQQLQASVASVAAAQRRVITTRIIRQLVVYDRAGRVQRRDAHVYNGMASAPWSSPSMDSLVRQGFVVQGGDGSVTYHAPDLEALMSDDFARTFCLRLAAADDPALIGISFTPSAEVTTSSIAGTFWIARRTARLHRLEFLFTGVSQAQRAAGAGGSLDFAQMANGEWTIARWSLTMPRIRERLEGESATRAAPTRRVAEVIAVHVQSGELTLARQAADTLYALPLATLHGHLRDQRGRAIAKSVVSLVGERRGRFSTDSSGAFRFDSVVPGAYSVVARDSMEQEILVRADVVMTTEDLEVPLRAELTRPVVIRSAPVVPPMRDNQVLLRGYVVDTAGLPVSYANVTVESRAPVAADAAGRFTATVRPGQYQVTVRRVGYTPFFEKMQVRRDTIVGITMTPIARQLAQVEVVERQVDVLANNGFYTRLKDRARGLNAGWFLTPEDIEARRAIRATQFLSGFPGIRIENVPGLGQHPVSGHGCIMEVFLDGAPIDLRGGRSQYNGSLDNLIAAGSISAIEVYRGSANVPMRFQRLNGGCGVVVIWTR